MNPQYAINDLLDIVEKLTEIVRELNPGRTEDYRFIDFLLARVNRELDKTHTKGDL